MGHYYAEMFPDGEKDRYGYRGDKVGEEIPFVAYLKREIEHERKQREALMNMDGDGI